MCFEHRTLRICRPVEGGLGEEGEVLVKNNWKNKAGITKASSSNFFSVNFLAFHFPGVIKTQLQGPMDQQC